MNYDFTLLRPKRAYIQKGGKILGVTIVLALIPAIFGISKLAVAIGSIGTIGALIVFMGEYGAREEAMLRFFAGNNLQSLDSAAQNTAIPEYLRGVGHDEEVHNGYRFDKGLQWPADVTEYDYVVGNGRSSQGYQFTVASFLTKKAYPQLFLDGRANGKTHFKYKRGQTIQLEGDFNKYFTLYAPKEAGSTALAVITPDIMHTLMTSGRKFDIEISGNMVSVVGKDSYYTEKDLPVLLGFVDVLQKEFSQLDWSWRPVYSKTGAPLDLQRAKMPKILMAGLIIVAILLVMMLNLLPLLVGTH